MAFNPNKTREWKAGATPETGTPARGDFFDAEFDQLYENDNAVADGSAIQDEVIGSRHLTKSVNLDFINEKTIDHGTAIEGVLAKDGNLIIPGNLVVEGDVTDIKTTNMVIEDRVTTLNAGEVGPGVTGLPFVGFEVDRGAGETKFRHGFRETDDRFVAGMEGSESPVSMKSELDAHAGDSSAHSATSAATANRIIIRDAAGRAKVTAPVASDDIARLDTVTAVQTNLNAHTGNVSNPHTVTKTQVGLGNVTDNAQLKIASNLSDLANKTTARTNLEVYSKSEVDAHTNATTAHGATSAATASKIIIRDSSGRAKVAAPAVSDDIARKDTVDAVQTNLNTHASYTGAATHGATSDATANKIIIRDGNGRAKVAAPILGEHIAIKSNVDTVQTNLTTHTGNVSNPHSVTKTQVGLGSVTNDAQLKIASNLSDLNNPTTARTNLDVYSTGEVDDNFVGQTRGSLTVPTSGWYRIATTSVGIYRNHGLFELYWTIQGVHGSLFFSAGNMYGDIASNIINIISSSKYGTRGVDKIRIVYHPTYSDNYAYLEVYITAITALPLYSKIMNAFNRGWSLLTLPVAGDVPSGYLTKEVDVVNGLSTTGQLVSNQARATQLELHNADAANTWDLRISHTTNPDAAGMLFGLQGGDTQAVIATQYSGSISNVIVIDRGTKLTIFPYGINGNASSATGLVNQENQAETVLCKTFRVVILGDSTTGSVAHGVSNLSISNRFRGATIASDVVTDYYEGDPLNHDVIGFSAANIQSVYHSNTHIYITQGVIALYEDTVYTITLFYV